MRRRFAERKLYPDGLESNDAEGDAARGDPASMRSWLSATVLEETVSLHTFWMSLRSFSLHYYLCHAVVEAE